MTTQKNFFAARSQDGSWVVRETKFDRQPGDNVIVDNKKYVIVTTGDRDTCIGTMNFSVSRNRQHIKEGRTPVYPQGRFVERNTIK